MQPVAVEERSCEGEMHLVAVAACSAQDERLTAWVAME